MKNAIAKYRDSKYKIGVEWQGQSEYGTLSCLIGRFLPLDETSTEGSANVKVKLYEQTGRLSFKDKKLILGTWQGIFLLEHRVSDKIRNVQLHFIGD